MVRGPRPVFTPPAVHRLLQALLGCRNLATTITGSSSMRDGNKLSKSTQSTGLRELRASGATHGRDPSIGRPRLSRASVALSARVEETMAKTRKQDQACQAAARRQHRARHKARSAQATCGWRPRSPGIAHDIRTPLTGIVRFGRIAGLFRSGYARTRMGRCDQERCRSSGCPLNVDRRCGQGRRSRTRASQRAILAARACGSRRRGACARAQQQGTLTADMKIARDLPGHGFGRCLASARGAGKSRRQRGEIHRRREVCMFTADAETATQSACGWCSRSADSGIGMSAGELKQLFRPFAQGSAEIARRYGGAGLGLSFVKRLCQGDGWRSQGHEQERRAARHSV